MAKKKNLFQKMAYFSAIVSFILVGASAIMLYIKTQSLGSEHVVSASFMATTFFFMCIGVVFWVIATTDIPSLKVGETEPE